MKNSTSLPMAVMALQLYATRLMFNTLGRLLPSFFGNRAFNMWFSCPRFRMPQAEQQAAAIATQTSIRVNELDISLYLWQNNSTADKTLLFIHGWSGRGTQIAAYIEPLTRAGYRVISFDAPAHGNTPGNQTSVFEFTDVVLALDKQYGPFDAAITHSLGGMVLACAMSTGMHVNKAVCICPPDGLEILLDGFREILALPESIMKVIRRKSFAAYGQITRDRLNVVNNVRNLNNHALLVHDRDDREVPLQCSRHIAQAWPNSELYITEGLGHRRILRDANVIERVTGFLQSNG